MTLQLATETSPVELAWAKYDAAALELNALYRRAAQGEEEALATRPARYALTMRAALLHREFLDLFFGALDPDPKVSA